MHLFGSSTAEEFLDLGKAAVVMKVDPKPSAQTKGGARRRAS
jgi:hypothetical protein